jgi:CRISPR-associated protein Cas2
MLILVTYDVATGDKAGQRRLRNVARKCLNFGQRVQNSVFECSVNNEQFVHLKQQLIDLINTEEDSLRFYMLGNEWHHRVEHFGVKPSLDLDEPLILWWATGIAERLRCDPNADSQTSPGSRPLQPAFREPLMASVSENGASDERRLFTFAKRATFVVVVTDVTMSGFRPARGARIETW